MKLIFFLFILFTLSSCRNRCENLTCFNGGICIHGKCVCVEGFTGDDCSIQRTPQSITIEGVDIYNSHCDSFGKSWDKNSCCADVMTVIMNENDSTTQAVGFEQDADCHSMIKLTGNSGHYLNPSQKYKISLYDYDDKQNPLENTYMGCSYEIPEYNSHNLFPNKIILSGDSSGVIMALYLKYKWD